MPLVQQKTYETWQKAAKEQTKGRNGSARTSSALQAFVLLFTLFNKSRWKLSQVLNSGLRFRHRDSPGEDHLVEALLTCLCKMHAETEAFFPVRSKQLADLLEHLLCCTKQENNFECNMFVSHKQTSVCLGERSQVCNWFIWHLSDTSGYFELASVLLGVG